MADGVAVTTVQQWWTHGGPTSNIDTRTNSFKCEYSMYNVPNFTAHGWKTCFCE